MFNAKFKDDEDVGDWEAEHDHLLEIENNQFSNEPLSKLQITPPKVKTPPRDSVRKFYINIFKIDKINKIKFDLVNR